MKKRFGSRLIAMFLTLIMLFSVASVGVEAAAGDSDPVYEQTTDTIEGMMDIASGFSWMAGEQIAGAVNGGCAAISLAFGVVFSIIGGDGPSFEEVLFDYLQEMRAEIIGKIDDVQMQVSEMQRELQDFIMNAFVLDDFDDVYMDVAQRFDGNSSTDFVSLVTNYASDANMTDNAKAKMLGDLVGGHDDWNREGTTIYSLDKYKNYLLGKTAVFNNKTIYQAAIEYYQSDALLGQEVLDRYDNEFAGKVYATYAAAIPKVIVCLQARELLLLKQAEKLRAQAAQSSDPEDLIDQAQIKEKEAELCRLKELEYVDSVALICEAFSKARATIHPYDYYDRSDTGNPMATRYLSPELGKSDFYNEALALYKKQAGKELNIGDQDQIYFANNWYNSAMLGEEQYPEQTSLLPSFQKTLGATGLTDDSRKYFADYILREHPSKTIREFLTDYGFDADSEENSTAGAFAIKSRTAETRSFDSLQSQAFSVYGKKVLGYVFGKLTYDYYDPDTVAPEYVTDKIYSAGGGFDAARYAPTAKNVPGGYTVPTLYLQTIPFETSNLETWIGRADEVIATQESKNKYTSDSYAAITQKYADAVSVLTNANESPDTVTQSAIDTATIDLIHALLSRKVSKDYLASWVHLQEQIDAAEDGDTITLNNDMTALANDGALTFPNNKTLTLDLNGYTIDRDLDSAEDNGYAICVNGTLKIKGEGTITGGNNTGEGGAVLVTGNGELNIEDGVKFEGNAAKSGGAIGNNGACYIYGGTFQNNTATENGGAIWNNRTMLISGGTVTDNTAGQNGGGVYQSENITASISGKFEITGNTANGKSSNYFINNSTVQKTAFNVCDDLDPDTIIGIRESKPGSGTPFTTGLSGRGTFSNFTSDYDDVLILLNSNGEAYTADSESVYRITFDANGGTGAPPAAMFGSSVQPCNLPDTDMTGPDGKSFEGWMIGEALYSAGDRVTLSSEVTAVAQWGFRNWQALQNIIDLKADGTVIKLDSDYTAGADDDALLIPENKTLTLDLNGHTLDRGLADGEAVENGNVITNRGILTITDSSDGKNGVITGGNTNGGGGISNYGVLTISNGCISGNNAKIGGGVWTSGRLTMNGGSVSGNNATEDGGGIFFNGSSPYGIQLNGGEIKNNTAGDLGGGVFNGDWTELRGCTVSGNSANHGGGIYNGGTLKFYSGTVSDNTAVQGGGIHSGGTGYGNLTLDLYDTATITGNSAEIGGGVYTKGKDVVLSGSPQVTGNVNSNDKSADNLCITDNTQMTIRQDFNNDAKIGVGFVNTVPGTVRVVTTGLAQSDATAEAFIPDRNNFIAIIDSDGEAKIGRGYSITEDPRNEHGKVTPSISKTLKDEKVTLTITPDMGYRLKRLSVHRSIAGAYGDWDVPVDENNQFVMIESNITLTAEFESIFDDQMGESLAGRSISLDGDIAVNYYMELSQDVVDNTANTYMHFTIPDTSAEYKDQKAYLADAKQVSDGNKTYYVFKCRIAAKDMASDITAQLNCGAWQGTIYHYSVKEYAQYLIDHSEEDEKWAQAVPLVKAMLNYGTYSQIYFEKNPEALANAGLDEADKALGDVSIRVADPVIGELPEGTIFEGATLSLKSETSLSLYFKSNTDLEFSCDGYTVEEATSGNYQIARIRGIKAAHLGDVLTLNVNGTDVQYSPLNYCKNVLTDDTQDEKLVNTIKSLYWYWKAAFAYFDPDHVHTPGAAETENIIPSTCTEAGSHDAVTYCTVCGEETSRRTIIDPLKNHQLTYVEEVPATFDAPGTAAHYICDECGGLFIDAQGSVTATEDELVIPQLVHTVVDLSALTGSYEAQHGDILTGTLSGDRKITVADGATVILKNADITCLSFDAGFAGITPLGDATIVLEETNTVKGSGNYPGIYAAVDHTLTIEGTGSLNASTGNNSPSTPDDFGGKDSGGCGIGGGYGIDAGNIVINSGTITATGGFDAAGIGSGGFSECGLITISGGTVTANGGYNGAGIGSGYAGSCGQIKISGGTVTANGGNYSAGIGSGREGDYGRVDIISTVTRITATRGEGCPYSIGPGNSSGFTIHKVYIDGEWVDSITESPYTYTPAD